MIIVEKCHISLVDFVRSDDIEPVVVVAHLATGLDYLHSKNIIHGALKPQNVLIWKKSQASKQFVTKITDYGLKEKTISEVITFGISV
jgi:serine/threonine protein kinase